MNRARRIPTFSASRISSWDTGGWSGAGRAKGPASGRVPGSNLCESGQDIRSAGHCRKAGENKPGSSRRELAGELHQVRGGVAGDDESVGSQGLPRGNVPARLWAAWTFAGEQAITAPEPVPDQNLARMRAPVMRRARLSRQMISPFEPITTAAPARTAGRGHSFQISQPNSVAHTMLL